MISFLDLLYIASSMFLVLAFFSFFNEKVLKLPTEIGLMAIAFIVSLTIIITDGMGITNFNVIFNNMKNIDFNDIVMNGFLVFLLFSGSAKIRFHDLTHDKFLISTLSFFSTLVATFLYAGIFYVLSNLLQLNFTFLHACIVGSIIAPTDPISAMSILQKAGLPKRLALIMEGESLFNDGVSVALFVTFSSINASGQLNPYTTFAKTITQEIFGAVLVGLIVSFTLFQLFKHTHQKHTEVLVSLAAVTSAYAISELLHVSAPISAVVVGIYFATSMFRLHENNEDYYLKFYSFWEVIDKILNGALYILIGFAVLFLYDTESILLISLSAIPFALFARLVSILIPVYMFSRDRNVDPTTYKDKVRMMDKLTMTKLLTWGGLKGGICIALAMGTKNIFTIEQYHYVIAGTYAVVAFSILVQGLTIKRFYARIKKDMCQNESGTCDIL
ncbi:MULTISPECIES: sodium:proton antiporter [unclassified Fusibacter]|uniref:cation:proton antiporter n=1 Tax=unclassified Fusibacter TaxID=2624464 RepID=UPI001012477A|nr:MULTISPECIES: sodium:proton antiporter [unclassified Fusibacter]MCK8058867.1 sodium:proton antiporter [Fusibacter sp. A2]NPE21942.1 sodium:proton antiporter [Fusibacter sp. A1]RXV61510.1 sodium:proton antiporter [Fusibacter sp. A1]